MFSRISLLLFTLMAGLTSNGYAGIGSVNIDNSPAAADLAVRDTYPFFGLAGYLNGSRFYLVSDNGIADLPPAGTLKPQQWLAEVGRFQVLLIKAQGLQYSLSDGALNLINPALLQQPDTIRQRVAKHRLSEIDPQLNALRYAHLWMPLAVLARGFEYLMVQIHGAFNLGWGLSLVLVAAIIRLALLPLTISTQRAQNRVAQITQQLAPLIADIKSNHDGEEAHNRMMAAHKSLGVTPFYSLRPMLVTLVQLPVLIAAFNALAEMPQLAGQSFLWIDDLAYPDAIAGLPLTLPFIGNTLQLLPLIMTAVSLLATVTQRNPQASPEMLASQRRKLYLLSAVFLLLFYPFPAAMVLYWTLATGFSALQQLLIKVQ